MRIDNLKMLGMIMLLALVAFAGGYWYASTHADMRCKQVVEREFGGTR